MTETTLRRRRQGLYTVIPPSTTYYAFFDEGGSVRASLYFAEQWASDRGVQSVSGASPTDHVLLIEHDSGGMVGDGSLLWWNDGEVTVVDPEVGSFVFNVLTAGWNAEGVAFLNGWIYWLEHEELPHSGRTSTFRLRKCRADGSSAATVSTLDFTGAFGLPLSDGWGYAYLFLLRATSTAIYGYTKWSDTQDGTHSFPVVRFPISGDTPTVYDDANITAEADRPPGLGIPFTGGSLVSDIDGALFSMDDTLQAALVSVWPSGGAWASSRNNLSVSGGEAAVYAGSGRLVRNSSGSGGPAPAVDITLEVHPDTAVPPTFVFMKS